MSKLKMKPMGKAVTGGRWEWAGEIPDVVLKAVRDGMTKEQRVADDLADGELSKKGALEAMTRALQQEGKMVDAQKDPAAATGAVVIYRRLSSLKSLWQVGVRGK